MTTETNNNQDNWSEDMELLTNIVEQYQKNTAKLAVLSYSLGQAHGRMRQAANFNELEDLVTQTQKSLNSVCRACYSQGRVDGLQELIDTHPLTRQEEKNAH